MRVAICGAGAVAGRCANKESLLRDCMRLVTSVAKAGCAPVPESMLAQLSQTAPENLRDSRCTILAFHALQSALRESGWKDHDAVGFIYATTTGRIDLWVNSLPFAEPAAIAANVLSAQALAQPIPLLKKHFAIQGPELAVVSSCSSSLQALAIGSLWIRSGKVKRCIVGTTDILSTLTVEGFQSLRLLSSTPCRPFDVSRTGINLGEGSAFLCLEAADENSKPWGFVSGVGFSTDAYHATSPEPEGKGSERALHQALSMARLSPAEIDWIYAHGTGSPANDKAEATAIRKVFGATHVTSTKAIHGHTLAASGCLESILGLMAMKENVVLPTYNFSAGETDLKISAKIERKNIRHFVKNSLGFGGINVSVIFSSAEQTKAATWPGGLQ